MNVGYATRQPEPGLKYLVLTADGPILEEVLETLGLKDAVWIFFLNEHKADRTWAPYFPFILSIYDSAHLWNFIRGNLFIFVFVEMSALCKIALDEGCKATVDLDNEKYALWIETPDRGTVAISSHMLTRIGMEFVSPAWVVRSSLERLDAFDVGQS